MAKRMLMVWSVACGLAALGMAPAQAQTPKEIVLHNFGGPPKGASPTAGVIRDSAGNLYGTAASGGTGGAGVVFKVDTAGHSTVLYSFTGGTDGGSPQAGVIRDSAGNFYGTTFVGGKGSPYPGGVVFKLDLAGRETVLHSFTGGADGSNPVGGVIRDEAGNLYGTTLGGGPSNEGVVFDLDTDGNETVLYSFTGGADGGYPYAGVIRDSAGNLYGTTQNGGIGGGVVFKVSPSGEETVLYSFTNGADGGVPLAGVIRDSSGDLYGTTSSGGTVGMFGGEGVVFKLDTAGHEKVLYSFTGGADGGMPYAGVIRDSAGNLYGTTTGGGTGNSNMPFGSGVVYKLDTAGNETVLYSFTGGADGGYPFAGVIRDSAGNVYGTTDFYGPAGCGVVFKLDSAGHETVLLGFPAAAHGTYPNAGVISDGAGDLYGTTPQGGPANAGVVYKLDSTGHQTVLYAFTGGADGGYPSGGVIRDPAANLYGTAGTVVYKLDTAGQETVLYTFTGGADGCSPYAGVIRDSAGNLYGTTAFCGTGGYGVVYKLDTTGHQTVLYSFTGGADGASPYAGVIRDSAGNLYGTTVEGGVSGGCYGYGCGVVFKVDPTGHETVLYSFTSALSGGLPQAGVIGDSAGNLYGTTSFGPTAGAVYKLDQAGQLTVLYSFSGGADGNQPYAGVVRDSAGNLYGTTLFGGAAGLGVVYELDTAGHETVLHSFTGGADGGKPLAGLFRGSAGNLFGTTSLGGKELAGVVFAVKPQ